MYDGLVLVAITGRPIMHLTWIFIDINPYLTSSESNPEVIAPNIEPQFGTCFQNIDGNNIDSGHNNGIDSPYVVDAILCKKRFWERYPKISVPCLLRREPHWFIMTCPLTY